VPTNSSVARVIYSGVKRDSTTCSEEQAGTGFGVALETMSSSVAARAGRAVMPHASTARVDRTLDLVRSIESFF
jgi:hypothetical protein